MKNSFFLFIIFLFQAFLSEAQVVDFSYSAILCDNEEIQFTDESAEAISWNWNFGDGGTDIVQHPTHTYIDSGTYTVKLQIATNTEVYSIEKTLRINKKPVARFIIDTVNFSSYSRIFRDSSQINNGSNTFSWDFNDGTTLLKDTSVAYHKYSKAGVYNVKLVVVDAMGCSDSTTQTTTLTDMFVVPNVFTPNNDGKNDDFRVYSNGVTLFSIDIYSRWGNLVFRREGHEQIIWDGRLTNGTLVKPGTYFYVIKSKVGEETYEPLEGFITILY